MNASLVKSKLPILVALTLAGLGAGCSNVESMAPTLFSTRDAGGNVERRGPETASDKIKVLPVSSGDLDCPAIEIAEGGATARSGGPDNRTVRYQFDISDTARECQPQGSQVALKIGLRGLLLIGPAGSPGAYSTNLKIVVQSAADKKVVYQKAYKIAANTSGAAQAPFELVADPIMLPLTRTDLDAQYNVTVGFGATADAGPPEHRRKKAAAHAPNAD